MKTDVDINIISGLDKWLCRLSFLFKTRTGLIESTLNSGISCLTSSVIHRNARRAFHETVVMCLTKPILLLASFDAWSWVLFYFFFLRNLQVNIGERHMHEYMLHTTINIQRCIYGCNSKPPHRWRPWAGSSISRRIIFFWIWIFDVTRRAFFVFPRMTVLDFDAENRRPTSV